MTKTETMFWESPCVDHVLKREIDVGSEYEAKLCAINWVTARHTTALAVWPSHGQVLMVRAERDLMAVWPSSELLKLVRSHVDYTWINKSYPT